MADVLLQEIKTSRKQVKTITEQSYKQGKVEGDAGGQRRDVKKPPRARECFTPSENNWLNSQIFKGSFIVHN